MRPYTFFITGFAGLLGMLLVNSSVSLIQKIVVFSLLFLSYGVNQVVNDLVEKGETVYSTYHNTKTKFGIPTQMDLEQLL